MSLKPIHYVALGAGPWLAVDAADIVAACESAAGDPQNAEQCGQIPDAIEYLTIVASAASPTPFLADLEVRDDRTAATYSIAVSGKQVTSVD